MTANIQLPEEIFELPLFKGSAEYQPAKAPLLPARLDARLRRLRHMPSTADESASRILEGMSRLAAYAAKWLSTNGSVEPWIKEALCRLERLQKAAERGIALENLRHSLAGVTGRLTDEARDFATALDLTSLHAVSTAIHLIRLLVIEHGAMNSARWRKPYLRRAYRVVDEALEYNGTTDAARYVPVLAWIRHVLSNRPKRGCAYLDVGCGAMQRAPGLILAGRLLREKGLCAPCLHGTDAQLPPRQIILQLLDEHKLAIYACNPVIRPLPRLYDAMLLANVHRHLPIVLQRRLLTNLCLSLFEKGLVFVTWRFDAATSPGICLEKRGNALVVIHQTNVI